MDADTSPFLSGSASRLDCLLDIWDSRLLQNGAHQTKMKMETETVTATEVVTETESQTETQTETGDAEPTVGDRLASPKDALSVEALGNLAECLGDSQPSVQVPSACEGGRSSAPAASARLALPGDGHDNCPRDLVDIGAAPPEECLSQIPSELLCSSVNSAAPMLVTALDGGENQSDDSEGSANPITRVASPPDFLSVSRAGAHLEPSPESCSSPLSEALSTPLSERLSSPSRSELSAPSADSGVSEPMSTDEPSSSFDLSITGESGPSAGGDSTGDESVRRPAAAGAGRRAARWRTAELRPRPRPLSSISTASSSSSSGGGSLPRSLARRRPPRPPDGCHLVDGVSGELSVSDITVSLPRTQSLHLDSCVTQADRVVAEILQTEAVYVNDLREVLQGYLLYWRDHPESGIRDEHKETLFSNYQQIYNCNRAFLSALEQCRSDPLWVAKCFVGHRRCFVVYTEYCTHYPRAMSLLTELMRRGTRTARLLRERQVALRHTLPLGSYLLKPVQRILKYHLLLQRLMTHSVASPESHRKATGEALRAMRALAGHIDAMKRKHESAVRVQEVQSLLGQWQGDDLTTFGDLLAEDTFRVPRAKMPRQVFLFEKMLLITKKRDDGTLVYKTHIICSNLMLIESVRGEQDSLQVLPFDDPREQYTLQARTVEHKRQWALRLKGAILESYGVDIPKHARELVMKLGQHRENGEGLRRKLSRRTHSVPEYLERRKSVKRAASAAGSVQQQRQQRSDWAERQAADRQPAERQLEDRQQRTDQHDQCTGRRPASSCSLGADCSCLRAAPGAPFLPDVDEEEPEEPSCDSHSSPHRTFGSSSTSTAAASASSGATEHDKDPHEDIQAIVEHLVLQNKHFRRILDKPRREVRRSPTSASESPSERSEREMDSDWCQDEAVVGGRPSLPADLESTASGTEERIAPTAGGSAEADSHNSEVARSACSTVPDHDEVPELVSWRGDAPAVVRRRPPCTSPRLGCRPHSAITIESHDNVEYVKLFDYGARPLSVAIMSPPSQSPPPERASRRRAVERTVSEPCRRVARRLTKLHHSGRAELRHLVGGVRSKSMRLSRRFEDTERESVRSEELARDSNPDAVPQMDSGELPRMAAAPADGMVPDAGSRLTWYCEASVLAESDQKVRRTEQGQQQQQQRQQRTGLRSFGSFRVLMRRSDGTSGGSGRSRWRPFSQFFEPSQSRQGPPPASEVHALSLQRLPTSGEQLPQFDRSPPPAVREVMSVTSLPTAGSPKLLPLPLDGGVRWLRHRLAGLIQRPSSESLRPTGDPLGARLAKSQLLESPLLTGERRYPPVRSNTLSMTSLASSQSCSSDSGSEAEECDSSEFYEKEMMKVLEHVAVEVCV